MTNDETLALFAQGRHAWNAWAREQLLKLNQLEESEGSPAPYYWTETIAEWHDTALADFSETVFEEGVDFRGFIFPSFAEFGMARFADRAQFQNATFRNGVSFQSTEFTQETYFTETSFLGGTDFTGAAFSKSAVYTRATFSGMTEFSAARFLADALFEAASFSGPTVFDEAQFSSVAEFNRARFEDVLDFPASFKEVNFAGSAEFTDVSFSVRANFANAIFESFASFERADFKNGVSFYEADFLGTTIFQEAVFGGSTSFNRAAFDIEADFTAIEGKANFSLANATFSFIPGFIQAHFAEAPRLDNVRIEIERTWPRSLADFGALFAGDAQLAARWRALKRLAIQGHDHASELDFFKGELKAQRWGEHKPWHSIFWFGVLYEMLSDFGRSLMRPLYWWAFSTVYFAILYFREHLARLGASLPDLSWRMGLPPAPTHVRGIPISCVAGTGDPIFAALALSVRKGFLFIGLDTTEQVNQVYACLYGVSTTTPLAPTPIVPDFVAFLGGAQVLISALLIFLFFMAIRNHFRIK